MDKAKDNRIILLESDNLVPRRILRKYKKAYAWSGDFRYAEKTTTGLLNYTDYLESNYRSGKIIEWV